MLSALGRVVREPCSADRMLKNDAARTAGLLPADPRRIGINRQTPAVEVIQDRLYATLP